MDDKNNLITAEEYRELEAQIKKYDYVRFSMCDIHGMPRSTTVPTRNAMYMLNGSLSSFAGAMAMSPTNGFIYDVPQFPDDWGNCNIVPCSSRVIPQFWSSSELSTVSEVICEPSWKNDALVTINPRYLARKQLNKLRLMGLNMLSAFETEFTVLDSTTLRPIFDMKMDYRSNIEIDTRGSFLYDIEKKLFEVGIDVVTMHTEINPGQFEMAFKPKFGIDVFDDMFIFRQALKAFMKKRDMTVTFMSFPMKSKLSNVLGSAFQFNHSLWRGDKNIMYDASRPNKLSKEALYWIGGLLKHAKALSALCCPTVNCYRYLHSECSSSCGSWGIDNRLTSLRINNAGHDTARVENRLPSSASNPYLVAAATLAAGMDGIENSINPPPEGVCEASKELPLNLEQALYALNNDKVMVEALGETFVSWFTALKKKGEIEVMGDHDITSQKADEVEAEQNMYLETI